MWGAIFQAGAQGVTGAAQVRQAEQTRRAQAKEERIKRRMEANAFEAKAGQQGINEQQNALDRLVREFQSGLV